MYFVVTTNKKSKQNALEQDQSLLQTLISKLDYLIAMCGTLVDAKERLEDIQEKIKYFEPASNALQHDQKIYERVEDLKLDISRAVSKGVYHSLSKRIGELELLLIERSQFEK